MLLKYSLHSFFLGRGGSAGGKFRISLALPVGAVINCADNTGKIMFAFLFVFGWDYKSYLQLLSTFRTYRILSIFLLPICS